MSSREITQLHTELGCFRGGTLKHTSYSHPGWELDPNNVLEVTSSLDSLFLQVVQEQFVHEQDPPQLQVPPGKQTKSINQSNQSISLLMENSRTVRWETLSGHSLLEQSHGSILQVLSRVFVSRCCVGGSDESVLWIERTGGAFIASRDNRTGCRPSASRSARARSRWLQSGLCTRLYSTEGRVRSRRCVVLSEHYVIAPQMCGSK